jgi:hypothetical protein
MRPQQTRGVHVAPDAAQEHAASSAAEHSRTLAEAAAAPHAQARRESSRRGAQRSCYPLVHRGTRQARIQRTAWRRSAAQKRLRRSRTSEACHGSERPRERPGATHTVQIESHTTQGVSTAHLKAFQQGGCTQAGFFAEPHAGARNAHDAAQSRLQTLGGHRATMLRLRARDEGGSSAQGSLSHGLGARFLRVVVRRPAPPPYPRAPFPAPSSHHPTLRRGRPRAGHMPAPAQRRVCRLRRGFGLRAAPAALRATVAGCRDGCANGRRCAAGCRAAFCRRAAAACCAGPC